MNISVLEPHGFCAGVTAALRKAYELSRENPGKTIYCLHELVHNELVVTELKEIGFTFVDDIEDVPNGEVVLFSAHGVSPKVRKRAGEKALKVTDATCPFVTRVHKAAADFASRGLQVVIIGHRGHAEVNGILGEAKNAIVISSADDALLESIENTASSLGVVSQTTMNADDVKSIISKLSEKFSVESMAQVCGSTKERQDAVKSFDGDALLVLGSANSSNTRRLCEVAKCKTFMAGSLEEVKKIDFSNIRTLGITSGASTPEEFFKTVLSECF